MSETNQKKSIKMQKFPKSLRVRKNSFTQYQASKNKSASLTTTTSTPAANVSKMKNEQKIKSTLVTTATTTTTTTSQSSTTINEKKRNNTNIEIQITNTDKNGKCSTLPRKLNSLSKIKNQNNNIINNCNGNLTKNQLLLPSQQQKFERSNSFFLTRKLTKIFNSLTGSKETLRTNDIHENPGNDDDDIDSNIQQPYKFTRSRSMILLRKPKRSVIEQPKLEQLCEEIEKNEKFHTQDHHSTDDIDNNFNEKLKINNNNQNHNSNHKQFEFETLDPTQYKRKSSSNIMLTIKRTFSNSSDKRKDLNPRWSASLHSLQEIDNMISYDNLSFIDYDKLGSYEKFLEQSLSYQDLAQQTTMTRKNRSISQNFESLLPQNNSIEKIDIGIQSAPEAITTTTITTTTNTSVSGSTTAPASVTTTTTLNVVRRRKHDFLNTSHTKINENTKSEHFDSNIDLNFDKPKNLYRQSIDNEKLKHLNNIQRDSFRLSDSYENIYIKNINNLKSKLNNEVQTKLRNCISFDAVGFSNLNKNNNNGRDENSSQKSTLKSKSLTHLDTLDSVVQSPSVPPYQQQPDGSDQEEMTVQQQHLNFSKSFSNQEQIKSKPINNINASSTAHIISTGQTTLSANPSNGTQFFIQKKKASFMYRKKPILSRSEISSSEYFSVCFYTDAGYQEQDLIPVIKGVTLFDALSNSLRKRNLSFSQIIISDNNFQNNTDAEPPPYINSLDGNTDTESLAGKVLTIFEKGGYKKIGTLQKAASFGSRTRPPRLLSSASTEETSEIEQKQIPAKQLKQRWSGLFGIKNPQQNQLCELLNNYAKNGVPQKLSSVSFDHPDFEMAIKYLDKPHKSWREFIHCNNDMTDIDIKIQSAIWELVTTEIDYIHALKTVTDLFLACLEAIQQEKILIDVDQNKLFSNIHDICEANLKFWTYHLYPMVAHSIKTNRSMCIDYFQPGFVTFATTFSPYKKYCAEQSTCQFYCKELNRTNALFTAYLAWCESQKMCNRLRLADILVRPMQRLTKYSLLLTAIRKHINDENDCDIMDSMIHSVESFVYSVNTHLTTRQENERLKGIMARIESYDVVDSNNEQLDKLSKQYCTMLDLCAPMKGCLTNHGRHLFMEGDLKLKDNFGKSDVHCFLLTDILLICKTIAKKGQGTLKVIRQPYLTDKLIVKHKDNTLYCIYLNEFQMVIQAFTLQCAEAKCWYDSITKAKHIYSRLKQGSNWDSYNIRYGNNTTNIINNPSDTLGVKRSPLNSSIGSRVSSLNNSHSGSVELNDSRNISIDFEKTNSLSSDEGSNPQQKTKTLISPHNLKTTFTNTLTVEPHNHLGQSLPNLNLHPGQTSNLYHTYSNNTLLVPGNTHSGNVLLSPSHRGISYPPPSPTRATLRRGFAFSSSIKNPPLLKTRNITSQSSINWQQNPAATSSQLIGSPLVFQQQQQQQEQRQKQQQQQQQPSPTSSQQPLITEQTPVGLQINETDV